MNTSSEALGVATRHTISLSWMDTCHDLKEVEN